MIFASWKRWEIFVSASWLIVVLLLAVTATPPPPLFAQQASNEVHRKAVQKVPPVYPEIAKSMRLSGSVRVALKVAPSGRVVSAEALGGHPILMNAAVDAVKQWRFEAASQQTNEVALVNFEP